jgi:hypothetical protein
MLEARIKIEIWIEPAILTAQLVETDVSIVHVYRGEKCISTCGGETLRKETT